MSRVFATDIDSVLIDISTPLEDAVAHLFSKPEAYGFMHSIVGMWDLQLAFGLSKEQMDTVWDEAFRMPNPYYSGATEFITTLQKRGYTVIGVTKRGGPRFQNPAKRDIPGLNLDDYIFVDNHQEKGPFVKALGAEWFLDDKIGNCASVAAHSPETKNLLFTQPWNYSLDIDVSYTRVGNYTEVLSIV